MSTWGACARPWLYAAGVFTLTVLAFVPALRAQFVNFDDDRLLAQNPHLDAPWPAKLAWMFTTTYMGHYQPLTWLSAALDRELSGHDPFAYHLNNVLLHAACAALLVFVVVGLVRAASERDDVPPRTLGFAASVGALFWAVHPLRVESVAWASERRDPLSLVLLTGALLAYLHAVRAGDAAQTPAGRREVRSAPSRRWMVASYVLFALSLLAKAWGMTFAAVLVLIDWYPLRRLPSDPRAWPRGTYLPLWREKAPFVLLGLVSAAVAWAAQYSQPDTLATLEEWPWGIRALQAGYGLAFYVWATVWPFDLAPLYERPVDLRPWVPSLAVASFVVLAVGSLVARLRHRMPGLAAAALIYAVTLTPVLGFAQSGPQLVADRYSYVSTIPFAVLVAAAIVGIWRRRAGGRLVTTASGMLAAVLLAGLGTLTWRQATVWHDSETLWTHALRAGHAGYVAHLNLGQALRQAGRLDEALAHYRAALTYRPGWAAWYNLGNALKGSGDVAGAEAAYLEAVAVAPGPQEVHLNLGNLYFTEGRLDEAIAQYRRGLDAASRQGVPAAPDLYLSLGMALHDRGAIDEARRVLMIALRFATTRTRARAELALLS